MKYEVRFSVAHYRNNIKIPSEYVSKVIEIEDEDAEAFTHIVYDTVTSAIKELAKKEQQWKEGE